MSRRLNVAMIVLDSLRHDFAMEIPAFRKLANRGWLFERMYAPATFTNAIMPSVRAGMYPPRHGRRAWRLKKGGWRTGGEFREDRLWTIEDYMRRTGRIVRTDSWPGGAHKRSVTMPFLKNQFLFEKNLARVQPFFLYSHFMVLHNKTLEVLGTPAKPMGKLPQGVPAKLYRSFLPKVDAFLEMVLGRFESAGILDNTLWLILSDHGIGLRGERHPVGAGLVLDYRVRVPCVIVGPGLKRRRVKEVHSLIDLLPSILDYLKVRAKPPRRYLRMQGKSVFRSPRKPPYVYMEAQSPYSEWPSNWPNVFGATNGTIKVMKTPNGYECFNLRKDPREKSPNSGLLKRADVKAMIRFIARVKAEGGRDPSLVRKKSSAKRAKRKLAAKKAKKARKTKKKKTSRRPEILMVYRGSETAPFSIRGNVSKRRYFRVRRNDPLLVRRGDVKFMEEHNFERV